MGYYAQIDYKDKVGNGPYTIAQIGCFITAFCNWLKKAGDGDVPPNVLNIFFTEHRVYLADPNDGQGVKDDLAWSSITAYDHSVNVTATGGNLWPSEDNAIIEFHYQSVQHPWLDEARTKPNMVTHFCCVASVSNHSIIDSYDGQVKIPEQYEHIYGQPVAYASYARNLPRPVPAPPAVAAEPIQARPVKVTVPLPGVRVITVVKGWGLERVAAAASRPDANSPKCWQEIAEFNGSSDWNTYNHHLQPGQLVKVPPVGYHGEGTAATDYVGPREHSEAAAAAADTATIGTEAIGASPASPALPKPTPKRRLSLRNRLAVLGGTLEGYREFKKHKGA